MSKHTQKLKTRRRVKNLSRHRKIRGAGWSDGPDYIKMAPGNLVHHQYSGPGKDCTGNPESIRPGYINSYTPKGLPGMRGGKRSTRKYGKKYRKRGGMLPPNNQLVVANPNAPPTNGSITPLPGDFPNPNGYSGSVSAPGIPSHNMQTGGRYGFFPGEGPLNPVNGVGIAPPPFGRIPCETGTYNPLNPDPNGIQTMSTAPALPPYVTMKGGVQVGDVDSMRYIAPTAGYRNDFQTYSAPSPIPGLMIQTPYDARQFNQACIKTGGSYPVGWEAGKFTPLKMNEITTRVDFDGSNGLLPMKLGGKRRTRRSKSKKIIKHRKNRK